MENIFIRKIFSSFIVNVCNNLKRKMDYGDNKKRKRIKRIKRIKKNQKEKKLKREKVKYEHYRHCIILSYKKI